MHRLPLVLWGWRGVPYGLYLVAAVAVLHHLWADPSGVVVRDNPPDQIQFEWFLTNGANAIVHGGNPLFTDRLNAPYGVNLMANTSVLALALPLAPVTLVFGAGVTFVVLSTPARRPPGSVFSAGCCATARRRRSAARSAASRRP
jgi:hypothetical protein